jgi:CheY-like chemotaxis protein
MNRPSRTVLIVDEDASMRHYHGLLLMRLQYVVLTAGSSEEALANMERTAPSVVLTSLSLQEPGGEGLFAAIRNHDHLKAVPVIALSNTEDPEVRSSCLKQGYAACLARPADPHLLYRAIQTATENTPRAHVRINMSLKAIKGSDACADGNEKAEYTSMISEGGMYLQTFSQPPKNTQFPFRLFLTDREIRIKAEVLYCSNKLEHRTFLPGMGLKFIEIMDDDRAHLRNFIGEQLVSDIMPGYLKVA